jgi:hypothetical protein
MNKTLLTSGISISLGLLLFATITPMQQAKAQYYPAGAIIQAGRSKRATEAIKRGASAAEIQAIMTGDDMRPQKVTPKPQVRQKKRK